MYKLYCRIFQLLIKIGNYFLGYHEVENVHGVGCTEKIADKLAEKHIKAVLLVIGPHIYESGLADPMIAKIQEKGLKIVVFKDLKSNPTDENVYAGLRILQENNCEAVIAFGGGSPIDCAKAIVACQARPNKTVKQLQGIMKVMKRTIMLIAVPTTSGTGSETTIAAVITESKTHHKASINDTNLFPSIAYLDPNLTVGLPKEITAMTGMDALTHAVESYTNHTYCTKLENDLALKAVKLIYDNLYECYINGENLQARNNMQLASFYAGRSFTRGCVGYVHAIGHTVSGLYNVPHGKAMATILPIVLRQFGPAAHHRLSQLADVCSIEGANETEKADKFISWIEDMNAKMNIPKYLDMIREEDKPQMVQWACKEANPLYPCPVVWNKKELKVVIDKVSEK